MGPTSIFSNGKAKNNCRGRNEKALVKTSWGLENYGRQEIWRALSNLEGREVMKMGRNWDLSNEK